jgi:N-glycosylase/DNA lyase
METLICKYYGDEIRLSDGTTFYTPPRIEKLATARENELRKKCRVGYRAPYMINVARAILNGDIAVEDFVEKSTGEARKELMSVKGIGPKVSDIILLYGFGKMDVFPMDRWLRRALRREYFKREKVSEGRLRDFALDHFGKHAGIAHLYMFYYERKGKIPSKII